MKLHHELPRDTAVDSFVVRVQFQAPGVSLDWNCALQGRHGESLGKLPERALDDAVCYANHIRDFAPLLRLMDFKREREEEIRRHFSECAEKLIEALERDEDWETWLSRLGERPSKRED